ncbi:uncharacterized protein LOC116975643 [Amblyraja radiata]|uniref:uncharacterized protein LOC116975643 n=1 Tax=Amblyraja radiata TaxID=386614 RepID=UPI001402FC58|nr:uncharacterized protein LOC116975643 [Amblyraja radiata]
MCPVDVLQHPLSIKDPVGRALWPMMFLSIVFVLGSSLTENNELSMSEAEKTLVKSHRNIQQWMETRLRMSPGEMRVVLLILASLTADSTASDPCVTHTVLDQPWRNSACNRTRCSSRWMDDGNLTEGWYRFSSYDNVKILEHAVPFSRCSGWSPGWLSGSHHRVGDGEVTRTVCFNWVRDNPNKHNCRTHQEIKIKKCDGYFVYRLKPTPGYYSVYCTDSVYSDPCVDHTVLDQPWRSTDCSNTQCTNGQWKSDENLVEGWYRFNSSGGWKIPETDVPANHCSGKRPGWLNGDHPNVTDGEVTREVCFEDVGGDGSEERCKDKLDIKVKNCSSYFVYELMPTHNDQVYCTGTWLLHIDKRCEGLCGNAGLS